MEEFEGTISQTLEFVETFRYNLLQEDYEKTQLERKIKVAEEKAQEQKGWMKLLEAQVFEAHATATRVSELEELDEVVTNGSLQVEA